MNRSSKPGMDELVDGIERSLKNTDPGPFSGPAYSVFTGTITEYVADLTRESEAVARRDQADAISAKHVEIAAAHLMLVERNRIYALVGTIGGVALGTCMSTLCAMVLVSQFPLAGIIICIVSGIIGGFALALSTSKG